jgi:hypothetical protein
MSILSKERMDNQVSFLKILQAKQYSAMEEKAIEFSQEMEEIILKSAADGFSGYRYQIRKDHKYRQIFCSHEFAQLLEDLMDGVKVKYIVDVKQSVLISSDKWHEHFIIFDWRKKE